MARIFMDGFESGVFSGWTSTGYFTIDNARSGRIGTYCAYSSTTAGSLIHTLGTSKSSIYIAYKISSSNISGFLSLVTFYNNTTILGMIAINNDTLKHRVYSGNAAVLLGTCITSYPPGIFMLVEAYYLPHVSNGTFIVKLNGITEINLTGIATSPSTANITSINFNGGGVAYIYYDDIIIDDANWINSSSIQGLVPTGAGATTQFDPSTGSNYACVDEIPPSDVDYISTNTPNEIDTYACGNLTGTINSVKAVQVQARCMQEGSPAVPKIQLVTRPSSTDRVSASKNVQTFQPGMVSNLWELNPDDSAAWESADVNGMEIGVKAVAS